MGTNRHPLAKVQQLQQENMYLKKEKEQLEEEIMTYRHDSKHPVANSSKEVKILKKVVKSLEVIFKTVFLENYYFIRRKF